MRKAQKEFEQVTVAPNLANLKPDQQVVARRYLWAHIIATGMDMSDTHSMESKLCVHGGGYGLLRELGAKNVFFVERGFFDIDFRTYGGSAMEVYKMFEDWVQDTAKELGLPPVVTDLPPEW